MALSATIYNFEVRLADADRNVYETIALRVARHPSETPEYLLMRVLAYCLEFSAGLGFSSGGLSDHDAPALAVRDLTGAMRRWIEVGTPEAARLHKASKATPHVAVYAHRDVEGWLAKLRGEKIHRAESIEVFAMDRDLLAALAARLERRMAFDLSIAERHLYLTVAGETLSGVIERRSLLSQR
jgi:uncharacterized protein YaeQ